MGQDQSTLLNGPGGVMSNLNELISAGNAAVACGPSCQAEKNSNNLYQIYLNAQQTLNTAPDNLDTAYKNYIVGTQGQSAYDKIVQETLTKQAAGIVSDLSNNFFTVLSDTVALNNAYNATVENYNNSNELYNNYLLTNKRLQQEIDDSTNDIYTNDRKAYYNNQEISGMFFWHALFRWIYIIILVCFLLCMYFATSQNKFSTNALILLALFIYPFIAKPLALYLVGAFQSVISLFPKNVYLTAPPSRDQTKQRDNVDRSIIPPYPVKQLKESSQGLAPSLFGRGTA